MRMRAGVGVAGAAVAAGAGVACYRAVVRGDLTLDTGVGRRVRPLTCSPVDIAAPREVVFDVVAAPYLGRTPRAMRDKLEVVERGSDLVLAAHRTPVSRRLVTTTVETVRFERPERIHFRLVRGPVPHAVEQFVLHDRDGGTRLEYVGELGTDFWRLGAWWADRVAAHWEATVRSALASVKAEAERRAAPSP